jgi:hypothetical protein
MAPLYAYQLGYGVGLIPLIPGGLFEVALGGLLLVRGFPVRQPESALAPV